MAIYFIQAADGTVKIGRAVDVDHRLRNLQTAHAYELTLLRTMEGGELEEWACHFEFQDLRIRGEWFQYSERMMSFIPQELSRVVLLHQEREKNGRAYNLVDYISAAIKAHPLKQKEVAHMMGISPTILSRKLAQNPAYGTKFALNDLEKYIEATGDVRPIFYLVEKHIGSDALMKLREDIDRQLAETGA